MIDFMAAAEAQRTDLIARRRDLHRHPELAFEEVRTAGIIAEELNRLGLEVWTGVGRTGVVAVLDGAKDGPTVLWRTDMDALPIHEENAVDYVSTVPGKMHACGHDGHVAIALGLAKLFTVQRAHIAGRIKFVFQPAEEIVAGAQAMIADGVLDEPRPDVSLGLHLWNNAPIGTVGIASGPVMASSSAIKITLTGRGGHAAMPHLTVDPVVAAAHLILALQTVVSRSVDPLDTLVLSITMVRGSDADNVIPDRAELAGTLRAYSTPARDLATTRIHEITQSVAAAMRCTAEVEVAHNSVPVVNDETVTERLRAAFSEVVDVARLDTTMRTMAAEDVSEFMLDIPGTYFFVGAANAERGLDYPHHHARFDFDEDALPLGLALAASAIGSYVFSD
ncbi:MAG: M20 metallopeptidase family protein [Chloroflexota bacterium]